MSAVRRDHFIRDAIAQLEPMANAAPEAAAPSQTLPAAVEEITPEAVPNAPSGTSKARQA